MEKDKLMTESPAMIYNPKYDYTKDRTITYGFGKSTKPDFNLRDKSPGPK